MACESRGGTRSAVSASTTSLQPVPSAVTIAIPALIASSSDDFPARLFPEISIRLRFPGLIAIFLMRL